MKKLLCLFVCLVYASALSQNKQLLYNVDDLPQTLMSNPGAKISFDKHIGIPFFSGISTTIGSSGLSVYDIFQEGGDINARVRDAIFRLSNKDFFTVNQQLELLSIGWKARQKEVYFSAGMYQELDAIVYFPKDLAILAYEGNVDYIDVPFSFSDLSATAEVLSVYHFGVNKKLSRKLRLGARAKLYSSIVNVSSIDNRGNFITRTTTEGPNFYSHDIVNANVTANTSGILSLTEDGASPAGKILGRAILSGNLGLGFDIGGTYEINEELSATASIVDIGFIAHRKDLRNYRFSGDYELEGIELVFPEILDGTATAPYWENLEDDIEEQLPYDDDLAEAYTTWRPTKFNASLNYGLGQNVYGDCDCTNKGGNKYGSNIGIQYYGIKRPRGLQSAVTAYYDRTWNPYIRTKLTYTADVFSKRNIGLLFSAKINKFNVYLAADNLLEYPNIAKARNASLQLGFQLIFDSNTY